MRIEADLMTLARDGRAFRLRPALRFLRVVGSGDGEADPNGLVGRVKLVDDVVRLGGEQFMESVILGETAYDVQPGFLGEPIPRGGA